MFKSPASAQSPQERLLLLMRLSQNLAASNHPDDVLGTALDDVLAVTGAERGLVLLVGQQESPRLQLVRGMAETALDSQEFGYSRSVVDQVLASGQPVVTDDAQQDARFSGSASIIGMHIHSIMCVPLAYKGATLGVIYVDNHAQRGIFTEPDLDLLNAIASNIAAALENTRLYAETRARLETLDFLRQFNQDVASSLELKNVLVRSVETIRSLVGGSTGSILTVEGEHLVFQVSVGEKEVSTRPFRIPINQGIAGWVVANGQPTLVQDAANDPRFYGILDHETGFRTQSLIAAPLVLEGKAIGVIEVFNKPGGFSQADLDVLATFAASASVAIENARLFEQAQSKLATLDLLRSISLEITSTLDLERVLLASTQAVKELLGGTAASVLRVDGDDLVFQVALGDSANSITLQRVPRGSGLAGWVVENKEPVIVNDVSTDSRFFGGLDKTSGFTTQSLIAVPLLVNETAIGVIEVFNKPGGFSQEDRELLETFASSAAFAIENARLYQVAVEKGRLERELQVARQVQTSFLPREVPQLSGWQMAARWIPAREVAGDYYDFIPLVSGQQMQGCGLAIADVADKGMPASLMMVDARAILRASIYAAPDLAQAVERTNDLSSADSDEGMFVTLFTALIQPDHGRLAYVNAGHNPPLLLRKGKKEPELLSRTGMALAIMPEMPYEQREVTLNSGDVLLMYTDGVPDALDANGQEFGMERLTALLVKHASLPAEGLLGKLEDALQAFVGEAAPFDDITILVLKKE